MRVKKYMNAKWRLIGRRIEMEITKELEAKLQAVLAERSSPGTVTDLDAGTLSDLDREEHLWAHLGLDARTEEEAAMFLRYTDKTLLMEIADGF
jgi:hypothetical protein